MPITIGCETLFNIQKQDLWLYIVSHLSTSRITALGWKSVSPSRARMKVFSSEMCFLLLSLSYWGNRYISPSIEIILSLHGLFWRCNNQKGCIFYIFRFIFYVVNLSICAHLIKKDTKVSLWSSEGSWQCSPSIRANNTYTWSENPTK